MAEKRRFRRYRKESKFVIRFKDRSLKAKTVDYSLEGLKAIVEDSPLIKPGDIVSLDIGELNIKQKGSVIWTKKLPSALMIGFSRIGQLKGAFRDFRLSDVLIGLQRSLKTGILEVRQTGTIKKVYIKSGDMVFAVSNQPEDRLGDVLLREGRITKQQFDHTAELIKKTGKKQGAILVAQGYIKPTELIWAITHQVEEIILSLFGLYEGDFEFREGALPTEEVITLKLSAANLIYRGMKRTDNIGLLEAECLPESILDFSENPLDLFQDIKFDEKDKKILTYINGRTNIGELLKLSAHRETETLKSIYALLGARILEVKQAGEAPHEISPEEILKTEEPSTVPDDTVKKIEDMHAHYASLGFYGVLGVKDWAPPDEIRRAYYRAAKEYHPDVHFRLSDELKGKLHEIFTYITEGYTILSDPERRKQYDDSLKSAKSQVVTGKELAEGKFDAGKGAFSRNNLQDAAQLFGEAQYLDGSQARYHHYYGLCLARLGRLKEAERALDRALKIEPSNPETFVELGHVFLKLGFPLRAKSNFEKALKIEPSNGRAKEGMEIAEKM